MILTVSFFACSKKEITTPSVTTSDSVRNVVSGSPKSIYPYTETYVGTLSVRYDGNSPAYNGLDTAYIFYLYYANEHSVEITSSKAIRLQTDYLMATIDNTFAIDSSNTYSANVSLGRLGEYQDYLMPYTFQLSGDQLIVNWDIPVMPLAGGCDVGAEKGTFTATKKAH